LYKVRLPPQAVKKRDAPQHDSLCPAAGTLAPRTAEMAVLGVSVGGGSPPLVVESKSGGVTPGKILKFYMQILASSQKINPAKGAK